MYIRTIGVLILVVSGLVAGLPAQSKTFPVSELKPGMVATGRTVFQNDQLEEFKAHILGVLHNSIGPRRDLILARLEGGPLANTGVIAGMSGSPVYIDGRLVGAVSYSLGDFAKEPLAGITPIEEMLADATLPGGGQRRAQVPRAELTLPVTVAWGEYENTEQAAICELLVERIPGARRVVLSGTAHLPGLDAPDALVAAIHGTSTPAG